MASVYSVKQINAYISNMFSQDFLLAKVAVQGEVSNCKYHSAGHIYFTLKDEDAAIACVMFAGRRSSLNFRLENGMQIVAGGHINVYEKAGTYQLYVDRVKQAGIGMLYERFERLKAQLAEEGMFDEMYKQPIPGMIHTLGVVTAPTGAAVQDICRIAKRRNPGIQILLYPAKVQGEGAAESIVRGIHALERTDAQTIIIGRGGGSIEDLWAFNEEIVADAVFHCTKPVISAVGHEPDVVISDYVADLRASTPSAAAELAVADIYGLQTALSGTGEQLQRSMEQRIRRAKERHLQLEKQLTYVSPVHQLETKTQQLADDADKLKRLMQSVIEEHRKKNQMLRIRLRGASPYDKLISGYAVVEQDGTRIHQVSELHRSSPVVIHFADGDVTADICSIEKITEGDER